MAVPLSAIPRPRPRIVTASAMKLEPRDTQYHRRRGMPWQRRAFQFVNLIPELSYASGFYAKMLKKCRIYPATRDANDKTSEINEGLPVELLNRIQDPGGGRSQLLAMYGKLMFITGEGFLFGRNLDTDLERWSFVATNEIELENGNILWRPTHMQEAELFPAGQAVAYRMWTPSPEYSGEATSPMLAVEEIAEELVALTRAVRATAVSRMVNGILKVPSELSFGAEDGPDDDPEDNKFLADMIDHITGVIENAGSAEAASPFIAEGATEFLTALEWIKTHDPATDYMERDLRIEAVKRLSLGLDMPPEVLMGVGTSNHWIGRQIMLEQWRSHGSPVAEQFADDLSEAYLRPALAAAGFENWKNVVVAIDDSQVVISPDRSTDADQAFDRGGLGWQGYRQLKGIDEDMAPTEEEMKIYLAIKLRQPAFLDGTPYEIAAPAPTTIRGPNPNPDTGLPVSEEPPLPGPGGVSRNESPNTHSVQAAAQMALMRCREMAGSRIRSKHRGDILVSENGNVLTLGDAVNGKPNWVVPYLIGPDQLELLGSPSPFALVAGGTDSFIALMREWGYTQAQAESLSETLLVHAAKTLFDEQIPNLSPGFLAQAERMKEVAECLT